MFEDRLAPSQQFGANSHRPVKANAVIEPAHPCSIRKDVADSSWRLALFSSRKRAAGCPEAAGGKRDLRISPGPPIVPMPHGLRCALAGRRWRWAAPAWKRRRTAGSPRRSFQGLQQFHIKRAISDLCTGGLSPGRVLLGNPCSSAHLAHGPPNRRDGQSHRCKLSNNIRQLAAMASSLLTPPDLLRFHTHDEQKSLRCMRSHGCVRVSHQLRPCDRVGHAATFPVFGGWPLWIAHFVAPGVAQNKNQPDFV
jgi:hypothetical protein